MGVAEKKGDIIDGLKVGFGNACATFVVAYEGTTCKKLTDLRDQLRVVNAEFVVVKNTLAKRAVLGTEHAEIGDLFSGTTALIWANEDPVAPAKVLAKYVEQQEKENVRIKGALLDGAVVGIEVVKQLSKLPGRKELIGQLLSLMNAPAMKLLQTINAPASSIVALLQNWKTKKGDVTASEGVSLV